MASHSLGRIPTPLNAVRSVRLEAAPGANNAIPLLKKPPWHCMHNIIYTSKRSLRLELLFKDVGLFAAREEVETCEIRCWPLVDRHRIVEVWAHNQDEMKLFTTT